MDFEIIKSNVQSYFTSEDLTFNILTRPLRRHFTFFARKIENSQNLSGKICWTTLQTITGIIASPILIGGTVLGGLLNIPDAACIAYKNSQFHKKFISSIPNFVNNTIESPGIVSDTMGEGVKQQKNLSVTVQSEVRIIHRKWSDKDTSQLDQKIKNWIVKAGIFKRHYLEASINNVDNKLIIIDISRSSN